VGVLRRSLIYAGSMVVSALTTAVALELVGRARRLVMSEILEGLLTPTTSVRARSPPGGAPRVGTIGCPAMRCERWCRSAAD